MGVIDLGIGDVAGAGITAGANITSTAMTNQANKEIAAENNRLQQEMFYEGQEFNAREAEKAYQRDIDKMKMEQEYNSPLEQVKRYQEAGINPAVALSGQGGTSGNVTSPTGAPSATTPNIPILTSPHMQSIDFTPVAQVYKTLVEAKKAGIESTQLEQSFGKVLKKMDLDIESGELQNFITRVYGPALQDSKIRENIAHAEGLLASAYEARENGQTQESQRMLNEALTQMNYGLRDFYGKERDLKQKELDTFETRMQKQFDEIDSRILANRAEAARQSAEANRVLTLLPTEKQLMEADVKFRDSQTNYTSQQLNESKQKQELFAKECVMLTKQITHQEMTNEQQAALMSFYKQQLELDLKRSELINRQMGQDYWNPFRYVGTLLSGASAGAAAAGINKMSAPSAPVVRGFVP